MGADSLALKPWLRLDLAPVPSYSESERAKVFNHLQWYVGKSLSDDFDLVQEVINRDCAGSNMCQARTGCTEDAKKLVDRGSLLYTIMSGKGIGQLSRMLRCGDACAVTASAIQGIVRWEAATNGMPCCRLASIDCVNSHLT